MDTVSHGMSYTPEQIREIAYQSAGAASVPFMQDHPDYVMPSRRIISGVEAVLRDLAPEARSR